MNTKTKAIDRRHFVRIAAAGAAGIPLVLLTRNALGQDLPKLSLDNPTAQALGYVHDASTVSEAERGGERNCANCNLYTQPDAEWGPCGLFPGKAVSAAGWCKGWVKRQ